VSAVRPLQPRPRRPLLQTPWYAAAGRDADAGRPQLHEYRGADFMDRFAADLTAQGLAATTAQPWYQANRLDGREHPSLRQAIHDGYYLVGCELSCDDRARTPLDPERVLEAWAELHPADAAPLPVMARLLPAGRMPVATPARQPATLADLPRPLPIARILSPAVRAGSATRVPLRAQTVTDAGGRRRTLLSGHLPLTDQVLEATGPALPSPSQQDTAARELAARFGEPAAETGRDHVLWRSGNLDQRLGALIQLLDENLGIGVVDGRLAYTADFGGEPEDPVTIGDWRDWLGEVHFWATPESGPNTLFYDRQGDYRVALNRARAHIHPNRLPGVVPDGLREAVTDLARALGREPPARTPRQLEFDSRRHYSPGRIAALTAPWRAHLAALEPMVQQARSEAAAVPPLLFDAAGLRTDLQRLAVALTDLRLAAAGLEEQFADPLRYRRGSLLDWLEQRGDPDQPEAEQPDTDQPIPAQLPADLSLIAPGSWLEDGPDLIRRRWRMLVGGFLEHWQGEAGAARRLASDDRLYQVSIHARVRGEQGCEYLVHSAPSLPFHVASYYETRLMPPRPIRMPSLKDLKKAVSGAAMILPEDLNAEVSRLRFPDGEVEQSGIALAGRWIYVFSIPIVTICAMILLMLMITILDFIFRWIPYAILRIPLPR